MKEQVTVLDIGSYKLSVITARRGVNNTFQVINRADVEYDGFYKARLVDFANFKDAVQRALKQVTNNKPSKISKLYVSVPAEFSYATINKGRRVFVNKKKLDKFDINSLYELANKYAENKEYEVISKQALDFYINDDEYIQNPIGEKVDKIEARISFILANKNFLNKIRDFLVKLGIGQTEFISSPLAQGLYYFDLESRLSGVMIMDIGFLTSYISVLKGNGITNMYSFSFGSANIEADLAEYLKLDAGYAHKLKEKVVLSLDVDENDFYDLQINGKEVPYSSQMVHDIIKTKLNTVVKVLKKAKSKIGNDIFNSSPLYLTGGGISQIRGVKDYISSYINKDIVNLSNKVPQFNQPYETSIPGLLEMALQTEEKKSNNFFNKIKNIIKD